MVCDLYRQHLKLYHTYVVTYSTDIINNLLDRNFDCGLKLLLIGVDQALH